MGYGLLGISNDESYKRFGLPGEFRVKDKCDICGGKADYHIVQAFTNGYDINVRYGCRWICVDCYYEK